MRGVLVRERPERCPVCQLQQWLCVCAVLPRVQTITRVVILRHAFERKRPSNTARILCAMLPDCRLLEVGVPGEPLSADMVAESIGDTRAAVLFPSSEAERITKNIFQRDELFPPSALPNTRTLILLDGTWGQAGRMNRRTPGLADLPRVCLPVGTISEMFLRKNIKENHVSTAETLLLALDILEETHATALLREGYSEFIERARFQTGKSNRERLLEKTRVTEAELEGYPYIGSSRNDIDVVDEKR